MRASAEQVDRADLVGLVDLMWEFDDAVSAYWKQLHLDLRELPCRVGELRVLWHIHHGGTATGTDLARRLGISRAAASNLLKRLTESGYLTSATDEQDHRRRRWLLTASARRLLDRVEERRLTVWGPLWRSLSADDQQRLVRSMERLGSGRGETEFERLVAAQAGSSG
ncbi:MAG: MarR family transcriptional regulator [Thermaerobacter sp.]|nr:MarR family transcriptional regulator [Thermaerobacter sp.]